MSAAGCLQTIEISGHVWMMSLDRKGELPPMPSRERFNRLHEQHFEAIRRYTWRRDWALADDIVSETFLVAWRRIDDVPDDTRPWLFGVVASTGGRSPSPWTAASPT
jgi:DNA-directed RNA polymerase specialized sigma24 family protein